jgi:hypothetical protein
MNANPPITRLPIFQQRSLMIGIAGVVLILAGFLLDRVQFLRSYLFAWVFFTGTGIGCLAILLMHHTVGGKWGVVIRRFCESGAATLPYMAVLFLPIAFGVRTLYPWAAPGALQDENIRLKAADLNLPFFFARAIFYFAIWALYTRILIRKSEEQDRTGDPQLSKLRPVAAPGLIVLVFTATFAFVDWIMSLEPHWFSTIYGAMFLVGQTLQGFAFVIGLLILFSHEAPFRDRISPQHVHDLGNMMFSFTVLWAYLSFSQFLIIWSGNLPEEIPWYLHRLSPGWGTIAVFLILFHFCVPFVLLLQRAVKRNTRPLAWVCVGMLAVRLVDVFWVVEPSFFPDRVHVHWIDLAALLALGGLCCAFFFWRMRAQPLIAANDPQLQGAPRETVAF